jgi:hypothetical protein
MKLVPELWQASCPSGGRSRHAGIFGKDTTTVSWLWGDEDSKALCKLLGGHLQFKSSGIYINGNDIAILREREGPSDSRFWRHMSNA